MTQQVVKSRYYFGADESGNLTVFSDNWDHKAAFVDTSFSAIRARQADLEKFNDSSKSEIERFILYRKWEKIYGW